MLYLEDVLKGSFDLIVGTKKHLSMGLNLDLPSQLSPIRRAKLYLPGLLKHPLILWATAYTIFM